jgi:hypothetical protein
MTQPESEDINFPGINAHPDTCVYASAFDFFGDAEEVTDELMSCGHQINHITKDEVAEDKQSNPELDPRASRRSEPPTASFGSDSWLCPVADHRHRGRPTAVRTRSC